MQVRFEKVTKSYGKFHAVDNLDLEIKDGALHFLLGPSGCGKTTTLRMLAGLETVSRGKIFFNDRDVTKLAAAERGIGMVFQNYALWPHMTVLKNIEYGLKLRKLDKKEVSDRIEEVLDFTQLTRFAERLPGQLSGGQQQRVALARALAIRPSILLLDEPLSNLDAQLRLEMRENIVRIHKKTKITTLYVTHDQKEALSMGTHITVMHGGKLIQSDTPKNLYNHPKSPFIANFIGEANFFDGVYQGQENGLHLVKSKEGLVLKCKEAAFAAQVGEEVKIALRPEAVKIQFSRESHVHDNVFSGKLENIIYLGKSEQFIIRMQGTAVKANIFHSPEHSFVEGDEVRFSIRSSDLLVLPAQEQLGAAT